MGNEYFLTDHIFNCTIEIEMDNLVFHGNGFSMKLPPNAREDQTLSVDPLIQIHSQKNITIDGVRFEDCFIGVGAQNSSGINIVQSAVVNCVGFYLSSCDSCSIRGNDFAYYVGVSATHSSMLDISYNRFSGSTIGVLLTSVTNSNISRNDFSNCSESGIKLRRPNFYNSIFENNFIENEIGVCYDCTSYQGISSNNSIFNNYWSGNHATIVNVNDNSTDAFGSMDQSSSTNPVASTFDPTLLPMPQPTSSFSPVPSATSATQPITPSPSPALTPQPTSPALTNSGALKTPIPNSEETSPSATSYMSTQTYLPTETSSLTPTQSQMPNPTQTVSPTLTQSQEFLVTQQPTIHPILQTETTIAIAVAAIIIVIIVSKVVISTKKQNSLSQYLK